MNAHHLHDCFVAAMTQRCRYVGGSTIDQAAGVVTLCTNLSPPSSFCLLGSRPQSHEDFASRVSTALAQGRRSDAPWSFALLGEWLDDRSLDFLAERGMHRHAILVGMWAPALSPRRRPAPAIDFRQVTDADQLRAVATINNLAYGFEPAEGTAIYDHYLHAPRCHAVVGYVDDEPVTCAAAFPTPHGIYLGGVATITRYRGRGYAESASRHALAAAAHHMNGAPFVLFAGRQRAAFYEPMGFRIGAELQLYRVNAATSTDSTAPDS